MTPQRDLNAIDQNLSDHSLPPEITEVKNAILALKINKASGIDSITGEMLKHAGDSTVRILHKIITYIWKNNNKIQEEWTTGLIS